jgi:hypothetical protein
MIFSLFAFLQPSIPRHFHITIACERANQSSNERGAGTKSKLHSLKRPALLPAHLSFMSEREHCWLFM